MNKVLIASLLLVSSVCFAQEGEKKDDAAAAAPEKKKRDVTRMPFTADSVKIIVTDSQPLIQDCYNEMLALTKKKVEGEIMTSWVITPEGMVKKAKVEKKGTTLRDPKFHECVVSVLSTMEFPRPADKADHPINFPFKLKAVE